MKPVEGRAKPLLGVKAEGGGKRIVACAVGVEAFGSYHIALVRKNKSDAAARALASSMLRLYTGGDGLACFCICCSNVRNWPNIVSQRVLILDL